jgi:hypothetical protein
LVEAYRRLNRRQDALNELYNILITIPDTSAQTKTQNLIRQLENPIASWATTTFPATSFSLTHPPNWRPQLTDTTLTLQNPDTQFTLTIITGILPHNQSPKDWTQQSPLQFSGDIEAQQPASIPGFTATGTYYREPNGTLTLEIILTDEENHIIHLKATPADDQSSMQHFGPILDSFSFK